VYGGNKRFNEPYFFPLFLVGIYILAKTVPSGKSAKFAVFYMIF